MRLQLRPAKQAHIKDRFLERYPRPLVVWWYGPITQNSRAGSVPLAVVCFRPIDDAGNMGNPMDRKVALDHLGLVRIGSIWRHGTRVRDIERPIEHFHVNFSADGWSCVSPADVIERGRASPIPHDEYPLEYRRDRNYLLNFELADGRNLLVPCMEFFIRCYGRTVAVRQALATRPWEEAERMLYVPDAPVVSGAWAVKLAKQVGNDDAVFLAHVKYDEYARRAVKSIYSQAESAFAVGGRKNPYGFLKVIPWFNGSAQLKVAGIWLNSDRTFLALRILGVSEPSGEIVVRSRENPGSHIGSGSTNPASSGLIGNVAGSRRRRPLIINLTAEEEPDRGASSTEVLEEPLEMLGERRTVIDRYAAVKQGFVIRAAPSRSTGLASTGEPHGSGKGIGYAAVHAPTVLESHGLLRDMWNAACRVGKAYAGVIRSVRWFTFQDGACDAATPKLIPLRRDRDAKGRKGAWAYRDVAQRLPRHVLVIAMEVSNAVAYLLEIQRRPLETHHRRKKTPEQFKGLAIAVSGTPHPHQWLPGILKSIQKKKGTSLEDLIPGCPGPAYAYKHTTTSHVGGIYGTTVLNALTKVGISVTDPSDPPSRGVVRRAS